VFYSPPSSSIHVNCVYSITEVLVILIYNIRNGTSNTFRHQVWFDTLCIGHANDTYEIWKTWFFFIVQIVYLLHLLIIQRIECNLVYTGFQKSKQRGSKGFKGAVVPDHEAKPTSKPSNFHQLFWTKWDKKMIKIVVSTDYQLIYFLSLIITQCINSGRGPSLWNLAASEPFVILALIAILLLLSFCLIIHWNNQIKLNVC
jgi:hypothetical protein